MRDSSWIGTSHETTSLQFFRVILRTYDVALFFLEIHYRVTNLFPVPCVLVSLTQFLYF